MIKIKAPILTEEYKVNIFIGSKNDLYKHASKYLDVSEEKVTEFMNGNRGCAVNTLAMDLHLHPLILIDGDIAWDQAIATLAHEASHAMDYIEEALAIRDTNGEFHAHGIGSIMRHCVEKIKKK